MLLLVDKLINVENKANITCQTNQKWKPFKLTKKHFSLGNTWEDYYGIPPSCQCACEMENKNSYCNDGAIVIGIYLLPTCNLVMSNYFDWE